MTDRQRPKIWAIDIETAPIEGAVWGLFDQNIGLSQMTQEWAIISFCAVPFEGTPPGRKGVEYLDTSEKADFRDDHDLCARLWEILDDADFIIAQNGKRFDLRKIRARLIMHGFPPHSPVQVLDTMLMARKVAAFTSNKLEWLAMYLSSVPKSKHNEFPGFELWAACMRGNRRAWAAMKKYNTQDVISMIQVYLKLRPWVPGHPNIAVYNDSDAPCCPVCGGEHVTHSGFAFTNVGKYLRYSCNDCGAWSRSRYTINTITKRKALLTAV